MGGGITRSLQVTGKDRVMWAKGAADDPRYAHSMLSNGVGHGSLGLNLHRCDLAGSFCRCPANMAAPIP